MRESADHRDISAVGRRVFFLAAIVIMLQVSLVQTFAQTIPALRYSSFLGGDRGDQGRGVALDNEGNIYWVGVTNSLDMPTTLGAYRRAPDTVTGSRDIFVAKFDPTGRILLWGTYVGGTGDDDPIAGVKIGSSGEVIVGGITTSTNFPIPTDVVTPLPPTGTNGFLFALEPDGSDLKWATYIGGSGEDSLVGFDFNVQNEIIVAGHSSSTDLPIPIGGFSTNPSGGFDVFLLRLNSDASDIISGAYLGGGLDEFASDVVVESGGGTFVTGWTISETFPTSSNALSDTVSGGIDAFVVGMRFDHSVLDYGTLIGGSNDDFSHAIAIDSLGDIYITGETRSKDFPDSVGLSSPGSWFATKFNLPSGVIDYSLFITSDTLSSGYGIEVGPSMRPVLIGQTSAPGFPIKGDGVATPDIGKNDIAIVRLANDGLSIESSSRIGGDEDDSPAGHLVLTTVGDIYFTGRTLSPNYPLSRFPFDTTLNRHPVSTGLDSYLTIWSLNARPNLVAPGIRVLDTLDCITTIIDSFYVYNDGNAPLTIEANYFKNGNGHFTLLSPDVLVFPKIVLYPGDSLLYEIRFNENGIGFHENELLIYSSDSLLGKRPTSLVIRGGRFAPSLQPLPEVRFGNTRTCDDSTFILPLRNNGSGTIDILLPEFVGGGNGFRIDSSVFPLSIDKNEEVNLRLTFSPDQPVSYFDTLLIVVVECNESSQRVPLSGRGEEIRVKGIPDSIVFSPLSFCEPSRDTIITIGNAGTDTLVVREGEIKGEGFEFNIPVSLPDTLSPGTERKIGISFTPNMTGNYTAELLLDFAPCDTSYSVVLSGSQPSTPLPSVRIDTLDFGTVISCGDSILTADSLLWIDNPSDLQVEFIFDEPSTPFVVVQCDSAIPESIDPRDSVRLCLRYVPSAKGVNQSLLLIPYKVGGCTDTLRVQLLGTHVVPELTPDVERIDLGVLESCRGQFDTLITFYNRSGQEVIVDSTLLSSGLSFLLPLPIFPQTVQVDDSLKVRVRFDPEQAGNSEEQIRLFTSPCIDTIEVEITGTVEGVVVDADRDSLLFAPQLACTPALVSSDTIRLSWSGMSTKPVRITSVRLLDTTDRFGIPDSSSLIGKEKIPNGESLPISLTFAPTTVGEFDDTLEVILEPCSSVLRIPLHGTALEPDVMADSLQFGNVEVGSSKSAGVIITNHSPLSLELDVLSLAGLPFVVDTNGLGLPINPFDTVQLPVTFSPEFEGSSTDSIKITLTNGCSFTKKIDLTGRGVKSTEEVEFCISGLYSEPGHVGEIVEIAIEGPVITLSNSPVDLDVVVRFDPVRFQFVELTSGTVQMIDEVEGIVVVRAEDVSQLPDDLPTVRLRLLAGALPFAQVMIDSVVLVGGSGVTPTWCDTLAIVTITNRCLFSNLSLGKYPNRLDKATPNPANGTVEITFQQLEDALTELTLWDASGREVLRPLESFMLGGRYTIQFNVANLPPGLYLYRIEAGTWSEIGQLVIRR